MAGVRLFSRINIATEAVRGTPIAPTRQLYGDYEGSFKEDLGLDFHEGENRGQRTRIQHATQTKEMVAVSFKSTNGVPYDVLPIFFSALNGTATAVGAGADKTWTQDPVMAATNSPKSFTLDVGDDVQNWRLQYVMWQTIKLAGSAGGLTSIEVSGFAQKAVKTAAAAVAANQAIKIPGSLWTLKFAGTAAGLAGAAVQTNLMRDWEATINTGLTAQDYADGTLQFSQHQESLDIGGSGVMTVDHTAGAITEFYDKYHSNPPTLSFLRFRATGPALGGSAYQAGFDLPVFYSDTDPLGGEQDGVNLMKVPFVIANDVTSAKSIQSVVTVCSLTALP